MVSTIVQHQMLASHFRTIWKRQIHRSVIINKRSASSCCNHYFSDDQSLNFVVSSSDFDYDTIANEDRLFPRIFSPALTYVGHKTKIDSNDNTVQTFNAIIEKHYTLDDRDQFVGGMGENDGGVWFVNDDKDDKLDTLDYWEEIRDVIHAVKENRHGIPFGIYSSGIIQNKDIVSNLKETVGISSIQVTLGSGDPESYGQVVGKRSGMDANAAFGEVCNFIVQSAESGFPVVAAVAGGRHTGPGSELAKALGAIDVVVYKNVS